MASVYTTNNGIELIGTGEKSGVWGTLTNQNFEIIDTALDGQISIELASAGSSGSPNTVNISEGQGVSDGNNRMFIFTDGASFSGDAYVKLTPNDAEKIVYIRNNFSSSSPHSIILFQGNYDAANDYTVPRGKTAVIYFDGEGLGAVASNMFDNAHFDALNIVGNADVGGNLTVTGDVVAGNDLSLQSDGAILNFGADDDVSLTHVADTAIRLNSDKALQFRDAAISIASSADGKLQIDADTEVEINTTTLDINATNFNVPPNSINLGTHTVGDYVAAVGAGDGLTRYGDANGEAGVPILRLATAYGDDVNPYGEKGLNQVLASPATHPGIGVPALPTFRSLVAADLPSLAISKVSGLQDALDDKFPTAGGTISGDVAVPGRLSVGLSAEATGLYSTAIGNMAKATGSGATAIGFGVESNGVQSTAMGSDINVDGNLSFGIGLETTIPSHELTQANTMAIMGGKVGVGTLAPTNTFEVNGNIKIDGVTESFGTYSTYITNSSYPVTVDSRTSKLWRIVSHSITTDFTINVTHLNLEVGDATNLTFVLENSVGTHHIPSVFQLGGTPITIKWQGGSAPTGYSNSPSSSFTYPVNVYSFTVFRWGTSSYTVLGSHVSFDS